MPEKTFEEFISKDLPLEQRIKGITNFPGKVDEKAETIIESCLPFYERLGLLLNITNDNKVEEYLKKLFSKMSIGEIIGEILKPELVYLGLSFYASLDFRLVFNDPRYNLYQNFMQGVAKKNIWGHIVKSAYEIIKQKYIEGLEHFAEAIALLDNRLPFIRGERRVSFITENEKEYVLQLINWIKSKNLDLPNEVEEFFSIANERNNKKKRTGKDVFSQLNGMAGNHVTIYGLGYEENSENTPALLTYRVKTLRSLGEKLAMAYSALILFYERIWQNIETNFYQYLKKGNNNLLNEVLEDWGIEYDKKAKPNKLEEQISIVWNSQDKVDLWNRLSKETRIKIVNNIGNYGKMISNFNTWNDVVNGVYDVYGLTLAYSCSYEDLKRVAERTIIPYLNSESSPFKIIGPIKYKEGQYQAIHITLEYKGTILELHLTTLEQLAQNDSVGEGCHTLYHSKQKRELEEYKGVKKMIERVFTILARKYNSTNGLIHSVKSSYSNFRYFLEDYGVISASPSEHS